MRSRKRPAEQAPASRKPAKLQGKVLPGKAVDQVGDGAVRADSAAERRNAVIAFRWQFGIGSTCIHGRRLYPSVIDLEFPSMDARMPIVSDRNVRI